MAKGNPIGVRFDIDGLELVKKERKLDSPQKVLNWFFENYHRLPKEFKQEKPKELPPPKTDSKWDFSKAGWMFQIEDFTEYPKKDCPPNGYQRTEYLTKKQEADDKIRDAYRIYKLNNQ
jgi:hypothetical protein